MNPGPPPPDGFFEQDVVALAQALIGCRLLLDGVGGRIVETEAYHPTEAASHSFRGQTKRNAAMFGPAGRVYVYRIYGVHWCLNIVGGTHPGSAVLIRALEPTDGLASMRARRGRDAPQDLCGGPGRLCQALGVTHIHDGLFVTEPPFSLTYSPPPPQIVIGPRIGITKAADLPWRFGERDSRFVSRPFPPGGGETL